jgi:hypothetical protein
MSVGLEFKKWVTQAFVFVVVAFCVAVGRCHLVGLRPPRFVRRFVVVLSLLLWAYPSGSA